MEDIGFKLNYELTINCDN